MRNLLAIVCACVISILAVPAAQAGSSGTPDSSALAYASTQVTGGSAATAAIGGIAGKWACVTQVKIHLAQVATAVNGDATLSDGTKTVHLQIVDTTSFGAVATENYSPPLQSSAAGGTWAATVPTLSGAGAGDVFINGYTRSGGC